jgi:hypothetical protein
MQLNIILNLIKDLSRIGSALDVVTHLAEGLSLAQCRATNTEWSVTVFVGALRLRVLRMEGQLILLLMT